MIPLNSVNRVQHLILTILKKLASLYMSLHYLYGLILVRLTLRIPLASLLLVVVTMLV